MTPRGDCGSILSELNNWRWHGERGEAQIPTNLTQGPGALLCRRGKLLQRILQGTQNLRSRGRDKRGGEQLQ